MTTTQNSPQLPARILYVDDEPNLRLTWQEILKQHGYQVSVAATVLEAAGLIAARKFDVLLTDLNINTKGDGLGLAAAFRSANPTASILIMTGYPDVDDALNAIKSHPDDYLLKPTEIGNVLSAIKDSRERCKIDRRIKRKRLAEMLREEVLTIQEEWLSEVKRSPELTAIALSDQERVDHLPGFLREMCLRVEFHPGSTSDEQLEAAREHGRLRRRQGYAVTNVVEEMRILKRILFLVLQRNLLETDFSHLFPDQLQMIDSLDLQLKVSLEAYTAAEKKGQKAARTA